jgi:hypothetical protein
MGLKYINIHQRHIFSIKSWTIFWFSSLCFRILVNFLLDVIALVINWYLFAIWYLNRSRNLIFANLANQITEIVKFKIFSVYFFNFCIKPSLEAWYMNHRARAFTFARRYKQTSIDPVNINLLMTLQFLRRH